MSETNAVHLVNVLLHPLAVAVLLNVVNHFLLGHHEAFEITLIGVAVPSFYSHTTSFGLFRVILSIIIEDLLLHGPVKNTVVSTSTCTELTILELLELTVQLSQLLLGVKDLGLHCWLGNLRNSFSLAKKILLLVEIKWFYSLRHFLKDLFERVADDLSLLFNTTHSLGEGDDARLCVVWLQYFVLVHFVLVDQLRVIYIYFALENLVSGELKPKFLLLQVHHFCDQSDGIKSHKLTLALLLFRLGAHAFGNDLGDSDVACLAVFHLRVLLKRVFLVLCIVVDGGISHRDSCLFAVLILLLAMISSSNLFVTVCIFCIALGLVRC